MQASMPRADFLRSYALRMTNSFHSTPSSALSILWTIVRIDLLEYNREDYVLGTHTDILLMTLLY